jgi:hypothetical protein
LIKYTTELEIMAPLDCFVPERLSDETVNAMVVFGSDVIYRNVLVTIFEYGLRIDITAILTLYII